MLLSNRIQKAGILIAGLSFILSGFFIAPHQAYADIYDDRLAEIVEARNEILRLTNETALFLERAKAMVAATGATSSLENLIAELEDDLKEVLDEVDNANTELEEGKNEFGQRDLEGIEDDVGDIKGSDLVGVSVAGLPTGLNYGGHLEDAIEFRNEAAGHFNQVATATGSPAIDEAAAQAAAQNTAQQGIANASSGACSVFNIGLPCVTLVLAALGDVALNTSNLVVELSAFLMNESIEYSVLKMQANIENINGIDTAWRVARDVANMFFIFILLYASIATIVRASSFNTKQVLRNVIIVGLLINFSLFFTQVVIDASNLLALNFHNTAIGADSNLGTKVFGQLDLMSIYRGNPHIDPFNIFLAGLFGTILLLVTAFVFFASALLFLIRYIVLIFLMVLSPFAFIAWVLPKTSQYAGMWWDKLISQAIFAPAYMLLILIALSITQGVYSQLTDKGGSFSDLVNSSGSLNTQGAIPLVINFIIVIGFMLGALIIAKQIGVAGSSTVMQWGKAARNKIQRGATYFPRLGARTAVGFASEKGQKLYDSGVASARRRLEIKDTDGRLTRFSKGAGRGLGKTLTTLGVARAARETLQAGQKVKFDTARSYEDSQKAGKSYERDINAKAKEQKDQARVENLLEKIQKAPNETERGRLEAELAATIRSLSGGELAKNYKNNLKDKKFAQHLSKQQLDVLENNEEIGVATLQEIKRAKFSDLAEAIEKGDSEKISKEFGKLSENDVEVLDRSNLGLLTSENFVNNIGLKEHSKIADNKGVGGATKKYHKDALGSKYSQASAGDVADLLKGRTGKSTANLPEEAFKNTNVLNGLTGNDLIAIDTKDSISRETRTRIWEAAGLNKNHPAHKYITNPLNIDKWRSHGDSNSASTNSTQNTVNPQSNPDDTYDLDI